MVVAWEEGDREIRRDGPERLWAFPNTQTPYSAELN